MSESSPNWLEQLRSYVNNLNTRPALPPEAPPVPRRIGLALGGGGGKGSAHVGVLKVLEELQLPLDLIVGTSSGGAVAILYAAGFSYEQICEVFRNTAMRRIAVPDPTRTGIIGQKRREELLTRMLGDRSFADLRIPCAVIATDLVSGQQVLLNEGSLVEAMLATTALPGIFPPVVRGKQLLADGGILNNLPVDAAQQLGATRVIAVELNDALPGFALETPADDSPMARIMLAPQQFAIAGRALSLLINHATTQHLRDNPPDLLLSPYVADIPTLAMASPEKGLQAGISAARDCAAELLALRAWRLNEDAPAPVPPAPAEAARPRLSLPFQLSIQLPPIQLPRWGEADPAVNPERQP
jgi:NTE family protein